MTANVLKYVYFQVAGNVLRQIVFAGYASSQGDFYQGRATFYGVNPGGGDTIMNGNCGYGYISPLEPLGWDIGALSDANPGFRGACGRCYEVQCDPGIVYDDFGQQYDRTTACYDSSASLVIRITDACPCNYPPSPESNRRWCCNGNTLHIDLSVYAFEKLADRKWGVINTNYRVVSCDYQPEKIASLPSGQQPYPPDTVNRPSGNLPNRGYDWTQLKASYVQIEADSRTTVIGSGALTEAWTFFGTEIGYNGSVSIAQTLPDTVPSSQSVTCVRLPNSGGLALFVSKYEGVFTNITGFNLAIGPSEAGSFPDLELGFAYYNSTSLGRDATSLPCSEDLTTCPVTILLKNLTALNLTAWNITFPIATQAAGFPTRYPLTLGDNREIPLSRWGNSSTASTVSNSAASPPSAPQSAPHVSQPDTQRPVQSDALDELQLFTVDLGGWLENNGSTRPRDRNFNGCGDLPAHSINAFFLRNIRNVSQDACIFSLSLTPLVTGGEGLTNDAR
eukprot:jgi/Botrbrau1/12552/Bobra.0169s0089.1